MCQWKFFVFKYSAKTSAGKYRSPFDISSTASPGRSPALASAEFEALFVSVAAIAMSILLVILGPVHFPEPHRGSCTLETKMDGQIAVAAISSGVACFRFILQWFAMVEKRRLQSDTQQLGPKQCRGVDIHGLQFDAKLIDSGCLARLEMNTVHRAIDSLVFSLNLCSSIQAIR
jgi:hypothetical protein